MKRTAKRTALGGALPTSAAASRYGVPGRRERTAVRNRGPNPAGAPARSRPDQH